MKNNNIISMYTHIHQTNYSYLAGRVMGLSIYTRWGKKVMLLKLSCIFYYANGCFLASSQIFCNGVSTPIKHDAAVPRRIILVMYITNYLVQCCTWWYTTTTTCSWQKVRSPDVTAKNCRRRGWKSESQQLDSSQKTSRVVGKSWSSPIGSLLAWL